MAHLGWLLGENSDVLGGFLGGTAAAVLAVLALWKYRKRERVIKLEIETALEIADRLFGLVYATRAAALPMGPKCRRTRELRRAHDMHMPFLLRALNRATLFVNEDKLAPVWVAVQAVSDMVIGADLACNGCRSAHLTSAYADFRWPSKDALVTSPDEADTSLAEAFIAVAQAYSSAAPAIQDVLLGAGVRKATSLLNLLPDIDTAKGGGWECCSKRVRSAVNPIPVCPFPRTVPVRAPPVWKLAKTV